MLSTAQKRIALRAAREAVLRRLQRLESEAPDTTEQELLERSGVFVSLHSDEELRGCIGVIEPSAPLIATIATCAVSAATTDSRFPPVTIAEMPSIRFEISVLGPLVRIQGPDDLEIGRHGVIVTLGGRTALMLPQVAAHEGWSAADLLSAVCRKAGLPSAAWQEAATRLEKFTAEVFGEEG
jgi:AmmeMemoRadiSam system protein A